MLNWIFLNRTVSIKIDLALNSHQWLMCRKTKPNHIQNHLEYLEESYKPKETCCLSELNEKLAMYKSKLGDLSRDWPKGSLFNSYNTKV